MKKSAVIIILALIAAGCVLYYKIGCRSTVYINDEPCVTVANMGCAERVLDSIRAGYSAKYGKDVSVIEKVAVRRGGSQKIVSEAEAEAVLKKNMTPGKQGYVVVADGVNVCGFTTKEEAGRFLVYAKNRFTTASGDCEEPQFKEKVVINATLVDPGMMYETSEKAFDGVFVRNAGNTSGKGKHKVKKGETASGIALRYGISLSRLKANNPEYNINRIRPGDTLVVSDKREKTPLTVIVRRERTVTETVKPRVTKVSSEILPYGKTKLLNPGKAGRKKVRYAFCYNNGRLVSREIVSEEYIVMPVNRQVAVGIKAGIP